MSKKVNVTEVQKYLDEMNCGVKPTLKINGPDHSTAVVVVDFGSPLQPVNITPEQVQELTVHLRKLTRDVMDKDVNIRVNNDFSNGIFWTSI